MSAHADEFLKVVTAATHALRSYQYGNSSTELAEGMANKLDQAVKNFIAADVQSETTPAARDGGRMDMEVDEHA